MRYEDRNDLLIAGYLPLESGVVGYENGFKTIAALTRMSGCKAKMVDWWFGWLGGTEQYKLWHPSDHLFSDWEGRENGNYIGASHLVHERLAGSEEIHKLKIKFNDPREIFDATHYDNFDGLAVCGFPGSLEKPVRLGHMCHFVRNTDYGCEMRSRFWLGDVQSTDANFVMTDDIREKVRADVLTDKFCRDLHQHAIEEMGYLAELLPVLYRQTTQDNTL